LYFKNKEDILISVFREKMRGFITKTRESIKENESASAKLLTLLRRHYKQLADEHYLAIVTQLELRTSTPELRHEIDQVSQSYLYRIDEIIDQGIEEGSIRDDINRQLVRQIVFGTLDETVTTWVMKSQRYPLEAQSEEVHELLTRGFFKQ